MAVYITPPPRNPVARVFAVLIGLLLMAGAFMLGLVALAIFAGFALLLGVVIWIRTWRLRRQLRRQGSPAQAAPGQQAGPAKGQVIDAEYTVVEKRHDPP
jgi:hypothetical protein